MRKTPNIVAYIIIIGTWLLFAIPVLLLLNSSTAVYFGNAFRTLLTGMLCSTLLIIPYKFELSIGWQYASIAIGAWLLTGFGVEIANWAAPFKHYNGNQDIMFGIRTIAFIGSFICLGFAREAYFKWKKANEK